MHQNLDKNSSWEFANKRYLRSYWRRPVKGMPRVGKHVFYDGKLDLLVVADEEGMSVPILSRQEYFWLPDEIRKKFLLFSLKELVSIVPHWSRPCPKMSI